MKKLLLIFVMIFFVAGCRNKAKEATESLEDKASQINQVFVNAREQTKQLRVMAEEIFANPEKYPGLFADSRYQYFDKKAYYNPVNDGGCAIFATGYVPVDEKVKRRVRLIEHLEENLKKIFQSSKFYTAVYITTDDCICSSFPYDDMSVLLPVGLNMKADWVTYWLVDAEHNPQREIKWAEPYLDAVGNGYMTSVIAPVYNKDTLEATVAIDLTIDNFSQEFLRNSPSNLMIVTDKTLLVAANLACSKILRLEGLEKYYYLKEAGTNVRIAKEFFLNNNKSEEIRELADKIQAKSDGVVSINGQKYHIERAGIPETSWYLVRLSEAKQ